MNDPLFGWDFPMGSLGGVLGTSFPSHEDVSLLFDSVPSEPNMVFQTSCSSSSHLKWDSLPNMVGFLSKVPLDSTTPLPTTAESSKTKRKADGMELPSCPTKKDKVGELVEIILYIKSLQLQVVSLYACACICHESCVRRWRALTSVIVCAYVHQMMSTAGANQRQAPYTLPLGMQLKHTRSPISFICRKHGALNGYGWNVLSSKLSHDVGSLGQSLFTTLSSCPAYAHYVWISSNLGRSTAIHSSKPQLPHPIRH